MDDATLGVQRYDRGMTFALKLQIAIGIIFENDQIIALGQFDEVLAALE
jgi:hypothetical protein